MQWHPSIPNVLVAGGKDGSITLFSSEEIHELKLWRGVSNLYVLLSHIYCSIVIVTILVEISVLWSIVYKKYFYKTTACMYLYAAWSRKLLDKCLRNSQQTYTN